MSVRDTLGNPAPLAELRFESDPPDGPLPEQLRHPREWSATRQADLLYRVPRCGGSWHVSGERVPAGTRLVIDDTMSAATLTVSSYPRVAVHFSGQAGPQPGDWIQVRVQGWGELDRGHARGTQLGATRTLEFDVPVGLNALEVLHVRTGRSWTKDLHDLDWNEVRVVHVDATAPAFTIAATVRDDRGEPVADALVRAQRWGPPSPAHWPYGPRTAAARTDTTGRCLLRVDRLPERLLVLAPDHGQRTVLLDPDRLQVEVTLPRLIELVVELEGAGPFELARYGLTDSAGARYRYVDTDERRARFKDLPAGRYQLDVNLDGRAALQDVWIEATEARAVVRVPL